MIVRHKLLADLVRLWKNDELVEKIDRLPIELSPRKSKPWDGVAYIKNAQCGDTRLFPLMGLDMTDEHDEVTPLFRICTIGIESSRTRQGKYHVRH